MKPATGLPPLAAYIHIPWCIRKCPYCDFNSHAAAGSLPEAAYLEALATDLKTDLPHVQGRRLQSIFFGGGTPSLFSALTLERILDLLERQVGFEPGIEITLEANPGTAEQQRFRDFRAIGINRLSLGIQSFHDPQLQALGRVHDSREARQAIDMAQQAGFDNLNLDLMHGLPGQDLQRALQDLQIALACRPSHLSWYQLTIEPNTQYWKQPPTLPEEELLWDIQEQGQRLLAAAGFAQYEISAYSQPGRQARHNLNYWQYGDFLGLGAGAHDKLTQADGRILRRHKIRQPDGYLEPQRPHVAGEQVLDDAERIFEFMLNALRLTEGVPSRLFTERTGLPLERIAATRRQAEIDGLLEGDPQRLCPTERGRLFLNDLQERFLP